MKGLAKWKSMNRWLKMEVHTLISSILIAGLKDKKTS